MKDLGQQFFRRVQISISGFYITAICFDKSNHVTLHTVVQVQDETYTALVNMNFDQMHKIIWSLPDAALAEKIILRVCEGIQIGISPCILDMADISATKVYCDTCELHTFLAKTAPVYVAEEVDAFTQTLFGNDTTTAAPEEVPVFCLTGISLNK